MREARWTAEIQPRSANSHLRQSDRLRNTILDTKVERIQLRIRREGDVDSIETKPCFVDDGCAEGMCFVEREDLPARLARVAKARN